jgi:hypothetical protein
VVWRVDVATAEVTQASVDLAPEIKDCFAEVEEQVGVWAGKEDTPLNFQTLEA